MCYRLATIFSLSLAMTASALTGQRSALAEETDILRHDAETGNVMKASWKWFLANGRNQNAT